MRLLIDTHTLLWHVEGDRRLGRRAAVAMEDEQAELWISIATVWELAIKMGLGRLTLSITLDDYVRRRLAAGYRLMPIEWTHAAAVAKLPAHHRDPFDRMLAAQALAEKVVVVSRDRVFKKYGVQTLW